MLVASGSARFLFPSSPSLRISCKLHKLSQNQKKAAYLKAKRDAEAERRRKALLPLLLMMMTMFIVTMNMIDCFRFA